MTGGATADDLTVWTLSYSSEKQTIAFTRAEEKFEAQNPGGNVEVVHRGTDEHKTALRVAAGSDTRPDVYAMWAGPGLGGELVNVDLSREMTKYYEQYGWTDRVSVPSQAFVEAFAELKRWADDYILAPFMGSDHQQAATLWYRKRAAMMLESDWMVNAIEENAGGTFVDGGRGNGNVHRQPLRSAIDIKFSGVVVFAAEYGQLNAAIVMTVLPAVLVYLIFQRYFVSGLTSGAVKG